VSVGAVDGAPVVGDSVGSEVIGGMLGETEGTSVGWKVISSQCSGVVPHHPCCECK